MGEQKVCEVKRAGAACRSNTPLTRVFMLLVPPDLRLKLPCVSPVALETKCIPLVTELIMNTSVPMKYILDTSLFYSFVLSFWVYNFLTHHTHHAFPLIQEIIITNTSVITKHILDKGLFCSFVLSLWVYKFLTHHAFPFILELLIINTSVLTKCILDESLFYSFVLLFWV